MNPIMGVQLFHTVLDQIYIYIYIASRFRNRAVKYSLMTRQLIPSQEDQKNNYNSKSTPQFTFKGQARGQCVQCAMFNIKFAIVNIQPTSV